MKLILKYCALYTLIISYVWPSVLYIYDSLKADTVFSVPSVSVEQIVRWSSGHVSAEMLVNVAWFVLTTNSQTLHSASLTERLLHMHIWTPHFQLFFLQFVINQTPLLTFPGSSSHLWTQYKYKCVISNSYVYKDITATTAIFWSSKS